MLEPILENGTLKHVDKEKGLDWLSSAKSNSQAIAADTFDDVANVIKDFENLPLEAERTDCRRYRTSTESIKQDGNLKGEMAKAITDANPMTDDYHTEKKKSKPS